jgi:hypothetical protein
VRQLDDGWLVLADVNYRPSALFWIILLITLFTWIGWLIPIAFYLIQKNTVKAAIQGCLQRVRNEFEETVRASMPANAVSDLERLAALRERGIVSDDEFQAAKRRLLGVGAEPPQERTFAPSMPAEAPRLILPEAEQTGPGLGAILAGLAAFVVLALIFWVLFLNPQQ